MADLISHFLILHGPSKRTIDELESLLKALRDDTEKIYKIEFHQARSWTVWTRKVEK